MYRIRSRSGAAAPVGRSRRPRRAGRISGFAGALAAAVIALSAVAGAAQAAVAAGPSTSLAFTASRVSAGTRPVLKFTASDVPAGSVVYIEMADGSGHSWQFVGRIKADSAAVRLPSDPVGRYEYRILVAQGNTVITTSAPAVLTVTSKTTGTTANGSSCTACEIANAVVPWLAPIVAPVIASAASQIGSAILAFLGLIFG
jgi:hypothetical protein